MLLGGSALGPAEKKKEDIYSKALATDLPFPSHPIYTPKHLLLTYPAAVQPCLVQVPVLVNSHIFREGKGAKGVLVEFPTLQENQV